VLTRVHLARRSWRLVSLWLMWGESESLRIDGWRDGEFVVSTS